MRQKSPNRLHGDVGYRQNVRLRSAYRTGAANTWYVNSSGNVNNNNATWANRFSPDCAGKEAKTAL